MEEEEDENAEHHSISDQSSSESSSLKNHDNNLPPNGSHMLLDKVKMNLANLNSDVFQKQRNNNKRWWTGEEVDIIYIYIVEKKIFIP